MTSSNPVTAEPNLVGLTIGEAGTADTDVLEKTEIADLVKAEFLVINGGGLLGVGLDAPNVVRVLGEEVGHKLREGVLEAKLRVSEKLSLVNRTQNKSRNHKGT